MSLVRLRPEAPRCRNSGAVCGRSSSGRARPCQGRGSEFEPRRPLQKEYPIRQDGVFFLECAAAPENSLPRPARSASNQEVRQGSCEWRQPFVGCREASSSLVARSKNTTLSGGVFLCAPRRSPSCQPAAGGYRSRQPGHFLESASLHPPPAALRRFPRRPLQKEYPLRQDGVFFLEMCRRDGEIAASTCAKGVKSGGETGHRRSQRERNAAAFNVRC